MQSQRSGAGWIILENPEEREELLQLLPVTLIHNGDIRDRPTWEWDPQRKILLNNTYCRLNDGVSDALLPK